MIRRAFLVVLPVLVAGCSIWSSGRPPSPQAAVPYSPVRAACEARVYDDPEMKQQMSNFAVVRSYAPSAAVQAMNSAKRDAVNRCLSQHGQVGLGGGVEQPH